MTDEEIANVADGAVLLPVTAGEIVLAYNLPGNQKELKLPRDVYPDIFLGKVTKWNGRREDQDRIGANPIRMAISRERQAFGWIGELS
jgi:phosphate transport system substrate-binding protein